MVARILTAPEPKAKRTVEGDLGVYVNRYKVIESIGEEKFREEMAAMGVDPDKTLETYKAIPKNEDEFKLVERLTKEAVLKAVERHAGTIRYVYGPSGRVTLAEGKDLTQVRHIVGTGGALTRLPHRIELMQNILKDNETGMKLYPGEGVDFLVDNDYIMASLGVLSKTHREGAIKLLEQSLGIKFPEKRFADVKAEQFSAVKELQAMQAEKLKKEQEREEHIKAMEDMGYDMSEYRNPEPVLGNVSKEEYEEIKREALAKDRQMRKAVIDLEQSKKFAEDCEKAMQEKAEPGHLPGCNHECKTCSRIHCQYRNTNY